MEDKMKQTPAKILDRLGQQIIDQSLRYIKGEETSNNEAEKEGNKYISQALTALEEAYTLSEAEIIELLPEKKKPMLNMSTSYRFERATQHSIWCFNEVIDLCIKTLRGKVKRRLSVEEMEEIIWDEIQVALQKSNVSAKGADEIEEILAEEKVDEKIAQAIHNAQGGK